MRVLYEEAAEYQLLALPPAVALELVDAIEKFAADGVGFVRHSLDDAAERRLYLPEHSVTFAIAHGALNVVAVTPRLRRRP